MSFIVSYDFNKVKTFYERSSKMGNIFVSVVVYDTLENRITDSFINVQELPNINNSYSEVVICYISVNDNRKIFNIDSGFVFVNGTITKDDYKNLWELIYSNGDYKFNFLYVGDDGIRVFTKLDNTIFAGFSGDVVVSTNIMDEPNTLLAVLPNSLYQIDFDKEVLEGV